MKVYRSAFLLISELVDSLCRDGKLPNAAAFGHMTWPMSVSIHDETLKDGKIHCYNGFHIPSISLFSCTNSSNGLAQNWYMHLTMYQMASSSVQ